MTNSKIINKKDIEKLLAEWSQNFTVYVPSRENEEVKFTKWDGEDTSFLDWYRNTLISAKASFFPLQEELFHFQKDKKSYHIEQPKFSEEKQLLFGIRPCDARALAILDAPFKDTYEDPYYLSKRKNTVLVGLGCTNPYDSCFCTSLDISPAESKDVDLMLTDIGDKLLMKAVSDGGEKLLVGTSGLEEATEADEAKAKEIVDLTNRKVVSKIDTNGLREKLLASFEDEGFWEEVAAKCLSCGVCTFLCPTCYCFDINDELTRNQGERFRRWDSCAFPVYTKMPMENPREEKWRRVRQRLYHKYVFHPMNFDIIACTGCGRCIRQCPVNWDITQILNKLSTKV